MSLQAQVRGGPNDGEYRPVTTRRIFMLEGVPPTDYTSWEEQADVKPLRLLPAGVYDLQRYDDGQLVYVRSGPVRGQ